MYRIGYISLQPRGDVTVGLNDRALIARDFTVKKFVWSAFNRIRVAYFVPEEPRAAQPLVQPHLTFHAPDWVHLTAANKKGKEKPFEAIAPMGLAVQQQGTVPWVRFVSKRVAALKPASGLRAGANHAQDVLSFAVASLDSSIQLAVDFVAPGDNTPESSVLGSAWYDHEGYRLRVSATEVSGQQHATLGWFHES